MLTKSYRTPDSPYARAPEPEIPVGGIIRLPFPEPPTVNEMLDLAKLRKRGKPVVYHARKQEYQDDAMLRLDVAGIRVPAEPWPQWAIVRAEFRLFNERDEVELQAGLKWPVDALVKAGWVENDSPRHLKVLCLATQTVNRNARGVDLWIRRDA
jgi:hypothetical protein